MKSEEAKYRLGQVFASLAALDKFVIYAHEQGAPDDFIQNLLVKADHERERLLAAHKVWEGRYNDDGSWSGYAQTPKTTIEL